ncbi:MAG: hypothetical protein F6K47_43170 [Symploca sp. SIO2E6]|nr:hypothetical protein [Symploca sp. SIO2E6]
MTGSSATTVSSEVLLVPVSEGGSETSAAAQLITRGTRLRQAIAVLFCFDQT